MKKYLLLSLLLLATSQLACQQPQLGAQSLFRPALQQQFRQQTSSTEQGGTLTGHFERHASLSSKYLQHQRDVLVWLPPDYSQNPQKRYPVLYMHDGNNLFDRRSSFGGAEWEVDEHAQQLSQQGQIAAPIIVGIYNTAARMHEYTWYPMDFDGSPQGGQGSQYARFLVEELKPLIDQKYRTLSDRSNTGVMGSSLGGLISFYIAQQYPQTFGKVGMMSPSIWWKERAILADVSKLAKDTQVWVDMGTQEGRQPEVMLQDAKDFAAALEQQGFQHFKNLAFHIEPGGQHNEAAWAQRIERPLRFFYSPN